MNRTTSPCQEHFSQNQMRLKSIASCHFERIIKLFMLAASISRLSFVHGFCSRAKPSIRGLVHPPRVCSIVRSSAAITTSTLNEENRATIPFKPRSSSSLAMTKSASPSCIEKGRGGNFHYLSLSIPTMETMEEVGALVAILSKQTDVLFLDGDLGAGKTTFSRGFIECKLGVSDDGCDYEESDNSENTAGSRAEQALRVTSPTYLLSNTYEYIDDEDRATGELTRE